MPKAKRILPYENMFSFIAFWWRCIVEGWHVGDGAFAAIEGFCFLLAAGTYWITHKGVLAKWEKWEKRIMKGAFAIFVASFFVSTVFVAPFLQFREAKEKEEKATKELARLTPPGSDIPYKTLATDLAQERTKVEIATKARRTAEEKQEEYRNLYIEALVSATNDYAAYSIELEKSIARTKSELKDWQPTNKESVKEILKYRSDLAALETKRALASHKELVAPFHAIAKYAVSLYQPLIGNLATNCGAVANIILIPSIDFMSANEQTSMTIVDGVSCSWKSSCFWDSASLKLKIVGKKAKPATATLIMLGTVFATDLSVDNVSILSDSCPASDTKQWIKNVDAVVNLLIESQRDEFR